MITVYRFTHPKYNQDLSGNGAKLFGGRWNEIGIPALYTSFTISLALVELFVHKNSFEEIAINELLEITIDDEIAATIDYKKLKKNWKTDEEYCQFMGTQFLKYENKIALQVPSAIIEEENNLVLNPLAKDFLKKVKIKKVKVFDFDERLFKQ